MIEIDTSILLYRLQLDCNLIIVENELFDCLSSYSADLINPFLQRNV